MPKRKINEDAIYGTPACRVMREAGSEHKLLSKFTPTPKFLVWGFNPSGESPPFQGGEESNTSIVKLRSDYVVQREKDTGQAQLEF